MKRVIHITTIIMAILSSSLCFAGPATQPPSDQPTSPKKPAVIKKAETNCAECRAKLEMEQRMAALEGQMAEIQKTLKTILDRLDQIPPVPPVEQVACSELSAKQRTTINQVCVTSKGAKFKRVARANFGEAWQDDEGLIWSDLIGDKNQYEAIDNCEAIEGRLPSIDDFERGEASGIREVLPNMKDHWFWSSSVVSYNSGIAYDFSGVSGYVHDYDRDTFNSVRCVAGEK